MSDQDPTHETRLPEPGRRSRPGNTPSRRLADRRYRTAASDLAALPANHPLLDQVPVRAIAEALAHQRDWARKETCDQTIAIVQEHSGAYGMGVDYAYTMVHRANQRGSFKGAMLPPKAAS